MIYVWVPELFWGLTIVALFVAIPVLFGASLGVVLAVGAIACYIASVITAVPAQALAQVKKTE